MALDDVRRLSEIAEYQWGLFTTKQAAAAGVARVQLTRLATAGVLERIMQGVYRVSAAPPHEHEQILAAWLAVGDGDVASPSQVPSAVVGGAAAARLHGIGDIWLTTIDLICSPPRRTRRPEIRIRELPLQPADVSPGHIGVPTLTAARTIADLVEIVGDLSIVGDALTDARRQGIIDEQRLLEHLDLVAHRIDAPSGRSLLEQLDLAGSMR